MNRVWKAFRNKSKLTMSFMHELTRLKSKFLNNSNKK